MGLLQSIDVAPGETPRRQLDAGYYDLWTDDRVDERRRLIIGPGTCYMSDALTDGARVWGLASHLYALRHEKGEGIGDHPNRRPGNAPTVRNSPCINVNGITPAPSC